MAKNVSTPEEKEHARIKGKVLNYFNVHSAEVSTEKLEQILKILEE
jgi:hypothetical protein